MKNEQLPSAESIHPYLYFMVLWTVSFIAETDTEPGLPHISPQRGGALFDVVKTCSSLVPLKAKAV